MITSADRWRASERLDAALRAALDAGHKPPCTTGPEWLSEDPADRAEAAEACNHCPGALMAACDAVGAQQRFGVWAGIDRTPKSHGGRS